MGVTADRQLQLKLPMLCGFDYAKDAMLWATQNGIINGKTDGRLDPTGLATRAQVATMIARYCAKLGV